jgi:hypothetical protein
VLKVQYGTVAFSTLPSSLTLFNGTGENDRNVTIVGTLFDLNYCLQYMTYKAPLYWDSAKYGVADTIDITINDLGHSGNSYINRTSSSGGNSDVYMTDQDFMLENGLSDAVSLVVVVIPGVKYVPSVMVPGAQVVLGLCHSQVTAYVVINL